MLQGREAELGRLDELVESARHGRAGVLVVLGEAGIGKSALLEAWSAHVASAADVERLSTAGTEQEVPFAFGALHRLLRPVLRLVDALPAPQAAALKVVFGEATGARVDPFVVGVATLGLLGAAAEETPVVCVVDDAHWLDAASADALLFAARRLSADRVAVVFAARDPHEPPFAPAGLTTIRLGALSAEVALAVLTTGRSLDPAVADRLVAEAGGNPLALASLPTALSDEQLAGRAPLPSRLSPGEGLQRAVLERVLRLDEPAQRLLLVVASTDEPVLDVTRRAAAGTGVGDADWDAAERSGLLLIDEQMVRLSHPLVAAAVSAAATSTDRRWVHTALASAYAETGDRDRATWHRAAATVGPNEDLAADLVDIAARAAARGGYATAADIYERASAHSTHRERRAHWMLAAATLAWAAGQAARAAHLSAAARELATGPVAGENPGVTSGGDTGADPLLLADIDRLRGRLEVNIGSATEAQRIFAIAAHTVAEHDPSRALDMALAAALMRGYGIDSGTPLPQVAALDAPAPAEGPRTACLQALLETMGAAESGDWSRAREALDDAGGVASHVGTDPGDLDVLGNLGNAALHVGDDWGAVRAYLLQRSRALEVGAGTQVLYALHRLGFALYSTGRWEQIRAHAEDARALATSLGQPGLTTVPVGWLNLLAALQGRADYDELRSLLGDLAAAHQLGMMAGPVRDLALWADGAHATSQGDHATALGHLARMRVPALRRMTAIDRIDAAVRADDVTRAGQWAVELASFGVAAGWPWAVASGRFGDALLAGKDASAEELFTAALEEDWSSRPFDGARIRLAFGEWLRRSQRRTLARTHLRAAIETFSDLEAGPWLTRATDELRATGESARKRDPSTMLTLTPMERKIADLVATGLSNKDVAAQCWISPRTVAFHLRNVFAKTGVTTRGELAQLVLTS